MVVVFRSGAVHELDVVREDERRFRDAWVQRRGAGERVLVRQREHPSTFADLPIDDVVAIA